MVEHIKKMTHFHDGIEEEVEGTPKYDANGNLLCYEFNITVGGK